MINWKRAAKVLWRRIHITCDDWCDGFDGGLWVGRYQGAAVAFGIVGMGEAIRERTRTSRFIKSTRIVSKPGAVIEVAEIEIELTDEAKKGLTIRGWPFKKEEPPEPNWFQRLLLFLTRPPKR